MARLVQHAVAAARVFLNDTRGLPQHRYLDAELIEYVNDAVGTFRMHRPDLFAADPFGASAAQLAGTDVIPVPDMYFPLIVEYVAGRAELREDKFAVDGRAATLIQRLEDRLTGRDKMMGRRARA